MYNTGMFGGGRMKIGGGYAAPTWGGAQPMASQGYGMSAPPAFMPKDGDGSVAAPVDPPMGGTMTAPPAMSGPSGGMMFQRPGPFTSVPFNQTFGGQPAPYADLTAQQLDARNIMNSGAGRFGSNMAARYGYAGGMAGWRPDAYTPGSQISPYGYQPRSPFGGYGMQPKGQFGINPPPGGLGQPPTRMPGTGGGEPYMPPRTGGPEPNPYAPPRTGGPEPNPFTGGVQPQPVVPGATGAKGGFTAPMMNLAGMDQAQVAQLMGTAKDDGQRIAMYNAFRAAQNPHAGSFLAGMWGGDDAVKARSQQWNEANASTLPVWDAKNNSFMSQQDYYAKQMGWK